MYMVQPMGDGLFCKRDFSQTNVFSTLGDAIVRILLAAEILMSYSFRTLGTLPPHII